MSEERSGCRPNRFWEKFYNVFEFLTEEKTGSHSESYCRARTLFEIRCRRHGLSLGLMDCLLQVSKYRMGSNWWRM